MESTSHGEYGDIQGGKTSFWKALGLLCLCFYYWTMEGRSRVNLITSLFGDQRLPMLILGDERKVKTTKDFDAKKAAISGFSFYGKNYTYIMVLA